jgi:hypothetical protein
VEGGGVQFVRAGDSHHRPLSRRGGGLPAIAAHRGEECIMRNRLGRLIGCGVAFLTAVHAAMAAEPLPGRFHFPPLETDGSLSVKAEGTEADRPGWGKARMVVDGTLTDGRWPEHSPAVYRTGKQTFVLDDRYSGGEDFVWDAAEKTLTPIGRCSLSQVPGAGTVAVRNIDGKKPAVEVLDFPADTGKPRVLWRGDWSAVAPLGVWDGAVVCVLGGKRLLVLEPGWPAREIDIHLGKFRWQPTGDGIRRGKALLLGELPFLAARPLDPYTVPVAVINLKTREIKEIGRIPGGWTTSTAVAHPWVSASWITQAEADKLRDQADKLPKRDLPGSEFGPGSQVIEETDQIVK